MNDLTTTTNPITPREHEPSLVHGFFWNHRAHLRLAIRAECHAFYRRFPRGEYRICPLLVFKYHWTKEPVSNLTYQDSDAPDRIIRDDQLIRDVYWMISYLNKGRRDAWLKPSDTGVGAVAPVTAPHQVGDMRTGRRHVWIDRYYGCKPPGRLSLIQVGIFEEDHKEWNERFNRINHLVSLYKKSIADFKVVQGIVSEQLAAGASPYMSSPPGAFREVCTHMMAFTARELIPKRTRSMIKSTLAIQPLALAH